MIPTVSRTVLPFAAAAFAACTIVQVFLAGLGVFDSPGAFVTHRDFGYLIGWFTLAILVLALLGRLPRRIIGLSALLLVQFALQSVFVAVRTNMPAVTALHPLNGFAILLVTLVVTRLAWGEQRGASAATTSSAAATLAASGVSRTAGPATGTASASGPSGEVS